MKIFEQYLLEFQLDLLEKQKTILRKKIAELGMNRSSNIGADALYTQGKKLSPEEIKKINEYKKVVNKYSYLKDKIDIIKKVNSGSIKLQKTTYGNTIIETGKYNGFNVVRYKGKIYLNKEIERISKYLRYLSNKNNKYININQGKNIKNFNIKPTLYILYGSIIILYSYQIYQLYLSKAAKSCKKYYDLKAKSKCINRYKIQGLEKQLKYLIQNKSKCKSSKNPKKCEEIVNKEIIKINKKINRLKIRLKNI